MAWAGWYQLLEMTVQGESVCMECYHQSCHDSATNFYFNHLSLFNVLAMISLKTIIFAKVQEGNDSIQNCADNLLLSVAAAGKANIGS